MNIVVFILRLILSAEFCSLVVAQVGVDAARWAAYFEDGKVKKTWQVSAMR